MIAQLKYVLACQWFVVRFTFYILHASLVFLSKPGARIIVIVGVIAALYFGRAPLELVVGGQVDQLWRSLVRPLLGRDLAELTAPINIEITAVALMILLFIMLMMLASMLQPVMGALWAPRRPIPPLPPLQAPNTDVPAVATRRLLKRRRRTKLPNGLASLSEGLPDELKEVLREKPQRRETARPLPSPDPRPTAPPIRPGTAQTPNVRPQPPAPPPQPNRPKPPSPRRPSMPPR